MGKDNILDQLSGLDSSDNVLDKMAGGGAKPTQGQSLLDKIKERYSKVPVSVSDVAHLRTPVIAAGQTIGALGDAAATGIGKVAGAITPEFIKKDVRDLGSQLANSQTGRGLLGSLTYWKDKYDKNFSPEQKTFLESAGNIASIIPIGKVGGVATDALSPLAKSEAVNIVGDAAKIGLNELKTIPLREVSDKKRIGNIVKSSFEKAGIAPKDPMAAKKFYEAGADAVPNIAKYAPENIAKAERPLEVTVQGIQNAKKDLFSQADALVKEAGLESMPNKSQLAALEKLLDPSGDLYTVLRDERPELMKELLTKQKSLLSNAPKTASQMQSEVIHYNSIAGNREKFSNIDKQINNALAVATKEDLELGLKALDLTGRKDLMRQYGNLKEVEKQLARASIKAYGRQNLSYLDVLTTSGGINALITSNPELLLLAATTAGTLHGLKKLFSPDRIIKNMFKDVEKITSRRELAEKIKSNYFKQKYPVNQ